jgi:hypothetical protein
VRRGSLRLDDAVSSTLPPIEDWEERHGSRQRSKKMGPMSEFDPDRPAKVHDLLNDTPRGAPLAIKQRS